MDWVGYPLLFAAGAVAGVINVVAGGGSFLTLPLLMFMGLPAGVANGTNRVGILVQNVGAVWSFERHGVLDWSSLLWAALPASLGAGVGVWVALVISDQSFKRVLALLMVTLALWTLWAPSGAGSGERTAAARRGKRSLLVAGAFFLVGVYGGFVQAGVGFLILAATTVAGLDLVRGNAVKVLTVLCFTVLALTLFAVNGRVDWLMGGTLAAGTLLGGLVGAKLTILKGHRWVRGVVTVTVVLFALKLWFT
ncbi:MAG: sulfite exporter TauE/SafE family protein [Thermoanaerobaculia bacterium]